jgi:hypothetical protein
MSLLREAVKWSREKFGDDLVLVVAPGGFFGFEGQIPLHTLDNENDGQESRYEVVDTTVGRVLFFDIIPRPLPFSAVNRTMNKKALGELIDRCYRTCGPKATVLLADALMSLGFTMAARAGISIAIDDMLIPSRKDEILENARHEVADIETQYNDGLITVGEKYNKVVDIWSKVTDEISKELLREIGVQKLRGEDGELRDHTSFNSVFMMVDSGARGSPTQVRQLAGMRGLMARPSGEIIETPITANFREGLSVLQYFISTHGARKGLADTALKTANSGYLTRRLVDVVQDTIMTARDCGTQEGMDVTSLIEGGEIIEHLGERVLGRVAAADVLDPYSDEVLVPRNGMLDEKARWRRSSPRAWSASRSAPCSPARCAGACAACATAATWRAATWSTSARPSASSPPSPSASPAPSSPCAPSTSVAPPRRRSPRPPSSSRPRAPSGTPTRSPSSGTARTTPWR